MEKIPKSFTAILIFFITTLMFSSCEHSDEFEKLSLKGEWKFFFGDIKGLPEVNINDKNWVKVFCDKIASAH